jgi:hypothetical protein
MTRQEVIQEVYARWLDVSTRLAFGASLLSFLVYASGVLPSFVPLDTLPALWGLPVGQYLEKTGAPSGWGWVHLLDFSDYLSLACMALVAMVTLICYLALLPLLLRLGEQLQAALVGAQVLILLVAASGFLAGGR